MKTKFNSKWLYLSGITLLSQLVISCSGGVVGGKQDANSQQVVIAGTNGVVYQGKNVLVGKYPVLMLNVTSQSGFLKSGKYVICGMDGVVSAGVNDWQIESSFGYLSSCDLSTEPLLNDNIYVAYSNAKKDIYAAKYNGTNWSEFNAGALPESGSVRSVANDTNGNIYIGVINNNSGNSSVYSSLNGVWNQLGAAPLPNHNTIYAMSINKLNNKLYVAATNLVYTLNGNQWESVGLTTPDGNNSINSIVVDHTGNLFVGSSSGLLFKLEGNIWQSIPLPLTLNSPIQDLAVDANNNLYFASSNGYVYKLTSQGWLQIANQETTHGSIGSLAVNNRSQVVIAENNGSVFQESGNQWKPLVVGAASENTILTTFVDPKTNKIYIGGAESSNNHSYAYSWDGKNWNQVNNELEHTGIIRTFTTDKYDNLYVTLFNTNGEAYVYESQNGVWNLVNASPINGAIIANATLISPISNQMYVATSFANMSAVVFESVNGAWMPVNNKPVSESAYMGPIALTSNNNLYAATGGVLGLLYGNEHLSSVFESVNGSWVKINQDLPLGETIIAMTSDLNNNLFIGTFTSNFFDSLGASGNVYESANGTWKLVNNGSLPTTSGGIVSMQVDKNNNLFVSTLLGDVYESINGVWILVNNYGMISTSMTLTY